MKRRPFFKLGVAALALPMTASNLFASESLTQIKKGDTFHLNYAPHFGMFQETAGKGLLDQLQYMFDQGFRSLEDNEMKSRPVAEQAAIGAKMSALGMTMGVFVANKIYWDKPNLTTGRKDYLEEFLNNITESVDVAARVNAKWMTVVPGYVDLKQDMAYQTAHVVDALRQAVEILEPHGLIMVLEPLNWWTDHAGQFLTKIPQAYEICRAVNSPSCKILFDVYHQQITEGNIIPNLDKAWSEVAYIQVGDNPGRKEPSTGEINYRNIFKHLHSKKYSGIIGMEHGNSQPGIAGEQLVIDAYRNVDNF